MPRQTTGESDGGCHDEPVWLLQWQCTGFHILPAEGVNSFARLDEIKAAGAAYFTIGSAFFAHAFGGDIADQINTVCDYMEAPHA